MPTESRRYWIPVLIIVGLAAVIFFGNLGGNTDVPDRTRYVNELKELEHKAIPLLQKIDSQPKPTEDQKTELWSLAGRFKRLLEFDSTSVSATFLAGKVNMALHNFDTAEKQLRQCVSNGPTFTDNREMFLTMVEAHHLLGDIDTINQKYADAFKEADYTVRSVPNSPAYLTSRASALVQLQRIDEAKRDLNAALKLDPNYSRAKGLLKFIGR